MQAMQGRSANIVSNQSNARKAVSRVSSYQTSKTLQVYNILRTQQQIVFEANDVRKSLSKKTKWEKTFDITAGQDVTKIREVLKKQNGFF